MYRLSTLVLIPVLSITLLVPVARLRGQQMKIPSSITLTLTSADIHHAELEVLPAGGYEIRTTGGDPYLFTEALPVPPDPEHHRILAFDTFCASGLDSLQVFFGPGVSEARSRKGPGPGVSEGWVGYTLDLSLSPEWRAPIEFLRLDFGSRPGKTIRVRNLLLRAPTAREQQLIASREAKQEAERKLDARLKKYIEAAYPCSINRVAVSKDRVRVTLTAPDPIPPGAMLREVPLYQQLTELGPALSGTPLEPGKNHFVLPRFREEANGRIHDRLLSKWIVARRTAEAIELLSHGRYADDDAIGGARKLPAPVPRSRKGIGGFAVERYDNGSDADTLGIGYVTVNIVLSFMQPGPGTDNLAFEYCGRTYYAHRKTIERYDRTLRFCAERDIVVSAIVLIPKAGGFGGDLGRIFMHPDCDPKGIFSMANLTCAEGLDYYAAAVDFLADRYSREDGRFGRIHHWIVHNEVDAGWVWTNAGPKSLGLYMDLYHRSMRTVHLIARKYDRNAKAFASLTHHWTWFYDPRFFGSKAVLEQLAKWSSVEGDFDWGIAYHPYPESLRNPRSWEDKKVDFTFNTKLITFKNIEVLAAWVEQPSMKYRGARRRTVHLSEQGPNSPDYSDKSLRDQAACMAYAWQKLKVLDAIEAFQYHNWIDNRHEGGLRIGLRKFPDEEYKGEAKPIWEVYRKLDTPGEEAACEFAKQVIGISDWEEVRYKGKIE